MCISRGLGRSGRFFGFGRRMTDVSPMRETDDFAVVSSTEPYGQQLIAEFDPGGIQCVEHSYLPVP